MRDFGWLSLLSPYILISFKSLYPSFKDPLNNIAQEITHVVLKNAKLNWFKLKYLRKTAKLYREICGTQSREINLMCRENFM